MECQFPTTPEFLPICSSDLGEVPLVHGDCCFYVLTLWASCWPCSSKARSSFWGLGWGLGTRVSRSSSFLSNLIYSVIHRYSSIWRQTSKRRRASPSRKEAWDGKQWLITSIVRKLEAARRYLSMAVSKVLWINKWILTILTWHFRDWALGATKIVAVATVGELLMGNLGFGILN
jgi:hypothetical protein